MQVLLKTSFEYLLNKVNKVYSTGVTSQEMAAFGRGVYWAHAPTEIFLRGQ